MKRNFCLFLTALAASATTVFAANKPNILWIIAENMGPDLGCYPDSPWAKQVRTPHIDQLAREGMRYRLAFATAPVCSPSRSAFMTGMYQTTIGAHNHRSHRHDHFSLPDGVRPVTHWLVDAGYFTANVVSIGGKQVGTGKTDLNFEVTGPVLNPALASKLKSPARDSGVADRSLDGRNSVRLFHSTEWTDLKSRQPFFAQVNLPTADSNPQGWRGSKENPWNGQTHPAITDPAKITVPPYYMPLGKDRLLVGTRDLFLFDVSKPAKPKQLTAIKGRPQVDIINGFARIGNAVFAANKQGYIFAVDVSAPDTIKLLGARETRDSGELSSPHDAAFCGDLLVVVSPEGFGREGRPGRLGVYRVADAKTHRIVPASQWRLVGRLEHLRLAGANRVMTRGAFAYIGSSLAKNSNRADNLRGNVSVVDLSDPAEPKLRGSVDFPDECGPNGLEIAGAFVFATGGRTVQAIDMSNPDEPRELGRFSSAEVFSGGQDDAHDLIFHDGHLFVTAQNSHALVVLQVEKPAASR